MTRLNVRKHWMFIAPAAILGMLLVAFIGATIVQLLWNWLIPSVVGWREVTTWEAFGLLVLCRILFGGSGFMKLGQHGRHSDPFTDEERARFRQRVRDRLGFEPPAGDAPAQ
jgi:hypothetical protein